MRYIDYDENVESCTLHVSETELPPFGEDDVLVKVNAFGINRADTLQRQGKYSAPKGESPILGLEVAGTVVALGKNVDHLVMGERVFGLVGGGGYAQYAKIHSQHIMKIPAQLTDIQAAGIAEVFLTAYQSLFDLGGINDGQRVLIHAGASGVGLAAIQLAVLHHCEVAVTSSTQSKLALCKKLGARHLINYRQCCFAQILKDNQFKADLIIDFIGGDYVNKNLDVLNQDGVIVQLAMLAGRYVDQFDIARLLIKRATFKGSTLRNRDDDYKSALIAGFTCTYLSKFSTGELIANIDTVYKAHEVNLAHQRLEQNDSMGKLIGTW
jgi:putative PIG3 family NAD(P)H quinone oxidoreductase